MKQARENIYAILADNPAATEAWKIWETGYVYVIHRFDFPFPVLTPSTANGTSVKVNGII